jgi:hypothetical protein
MAISADYPTPVTVNGFTCKNCTDVDMAKKHIDPSHPKDGPFGINADPSKHPLDVRKAEAARKAAPHGPAVHFGGALAGLDPAAAPQAYASTAPGAVLNISA